MLCHRSVWGGALTLALVLCVALPGVARADGMPAPNVWSAVRTDAPMWFSFSVGELDEELLSEVSIRLESRPIHNASFEVFVSGDWGYWDKHDGEDWFGVSTETPAGDALWVGSLPPGGYFVHVDPAGAQEIKLSISGSVVYGCGCVDIHYQPQNTFTVAPSPAVAAPTVAAVAAAPAVAVAPVTAPVRSPVAAAPMAAAKHAPPVPGMWMENSDNDAHWVTFYVNRVDGQVTNHVNISLDAVPVAGGSFEVFDSVGARYWGPPEAESWIGASSVQDNGGIAWAGDLPPGAYYVRMDPEGVQSCLLAITGEAIAY